MNPCNCTILGRIITPTGEKLKFIYYFFLTKFFFCIIINLFSLSDCFLLFAFLHSIERHAELVLPFFFSVQMTFLCGNVCHFIENSYFATSRQVLGHWQEDSVSHLMLNNLCTLLNMTESPQGPSNECGFQTTAERTRILSDFKLIMN